MNESPRPASSWPGLAGALLVLGIVAWFAFGGAASRGVQGLSPGALYATRLTDLEGASTPLGKWQGKIMLLNFWAPWCSPCRQEIPLLVHTQDKYRALGLTVVGIGVDDRRKVMQYARDAQVNYPVLVGDVESTLALAERLGDPSGALPYSVVIDNTGHVLDRHLGGLSENQLDALLAKALAPPGALP